MRIALGLGRHQPLIWLPEALLIAVPILVHGLTLCGLLSENPLWLSTGLGKGWRSLGLIGGLPGWIDGNAGVTVQALGRLAMRDWAHGTIPWWNPYSGIGLPLAGEMQPAAFFPPSVLLALPSGVVLLRIFLQIVAGLATWALLRGLGLSVLASVTGGVLFELNGTFAWVQDSAMLPVAFLPLMLLGVEQSRVAATQGVRRGGWRLLGAAIALSILAGFPERTYLDGLLVGAWSLLRLWQSRGCRGVLALRLAKAVTFALALCAPLILAFLLFFGQSTVGLRDLSHETLLPANWLMLLAPYACGPIFFGDRWELWYAIGGYIGTPVVLLAFAGTFGRAERALRLLLAASAILVLSKCGGMPVLTAAWNAIPMIRHAHFCVYTSDTYAFCAIVLASFALDELRARAPTRLLWAAFLSGSAIVAAIACGWTTLQALSTVPGGRLWLIGALAWSVLITGAITGLALVGRRRLVACLLCADAVVQSGLPLLAGTPPSAQRLDLAAVGYLQAHLGLQRFYTLGPIPPNYGAYWGIAQINHNYAPAPKLWTAHIRSRLDPTVDDVTFDGSWPLPAEGHPSHADYLLRNEAAFETLAVRYVAAYAGSHPFTSLSAGYRHAKAEEPVPLLPASQVELRPAPLEKALRAGRLALRFGTYLGASRGAVRARLCAGEVCADATADLGTARDNQWLEMPLSQPIAVIAGQPLRLTLVHPDGTPVAIWSWCCRAGSGHQFQPDFGLLPADAPSLVFSSERVDLYELPHPAPYASARGCALRAVARTDFVAECTIASRLLRRELFSPGWRANVNGVAATIGADDIFQSVPLPAGRSEIRFSYAPPGSTPAG
ncbi:glycosyltransferase family protein, partial [Acidisphaera rubrifaciens]|uniref:hypothetical protein n=1 Tax=Acidisphaera rubrifaciens TaxID=50715 RepID=UPI000B0B8CAA